MFYNKKDEFNKDIKDFSNEELKIEEVQPKKKTKRKRKNSLEKIFSPSQSRFLENLKKKMKDPQRLQEEAERRKLNYVEPIKQKGKQMDYLRSIIQAKVLSR